MGKRPLLARRVVPIRCMRTDLTATMKILDPSIRLAERDGLCAFGVMAKAPRAGKVKTRLSPPLTLDESAELNICFLRDTLSNISQVKGATGVVVYTPAGEEG